MAKLAALFILCMVNYCLGQGYGGSGTTWQEELGMEEAATVDASMPLVVTTTGDKTSSSVYGSMQDGTGAMYGPRHDGTFYSSGQDGTGTVYGKEHGRPSPHEDGRGGTQHGTIYSSVNEGTQVVFGEESSGDHYSYEEEDAVKDYGEDVYVEEMDDQSEEDHRKVVYFDVGKKQAEIEQIIIEDSDEDEDYHNQFEDIVDLDYDNQGSSHGKGDYDELKSSETSGESRFLTPIHFRSGSGGAAGGGHSGGIAAVSSEVPENVRVMTVPKKLQFYCNATQDEQGEYPSIDWYHNGKSFSSSERVHVHQNGTVIIEPTEKEDVGEYNCKYHSDTLNAANERTYTVIILSYKKLPKSGTAIEEENFSLTCDVVGEPLPWVKWRKDNESIGDAITDGRYNLTRKDDTKPEDSTLTIYGIKWEDRGMYECCFSNFEGFELCTNSYIRVKDIYAALWPFLGIVLEVVILCLIIFIYEKRRTKNDFEESDTDQGNNMKEGPN